MKDLLLLIAIVLLIILGGPFTAGMDYLLEQALPWSVR